MKTDKRFIANRIKTPDGTILWSRFTHDYIKYTDKITGEEYMLDGGNDYRRTYFGVPFEDMAVFDDEPWEKQRQVILRGTLLPDDMLVYIPLCRLTDSHLNALLEYCDKNNQLYFLDYVKKEIDYRKDNNITISEEYTPKDYINNIISPNN